MKMGLSSLGQMASSFLWKHGCLGKCTKVHKEMWLHGANGPKFLGETCWEHEPQGTCFPKELQPIFVGEPYFSKEFEPICPREVASPFSHGKLGKLG